MTDEHVSTVYEKCIRHGQTRVTRLLTLSDVSNGREGINLGLT